MADERSSIFNQRATEKLRSPDDLDKYVRVTNPSVWVILAACIALLAGLLVWGVFGAVTTSVSTTGTVVTLDESKVSSAMGIDSQLPDKKVAVCFLSAEDVANVDVGEEADVGGQTMKVSWVSPIPASPDEWDGLIGSDYLVKALFQGDWAYPVSFEGDVSKLEEGVPIKVTITTERIAPISLILNRQG